MIILVLNMKRTTQLLITVLFVIGGYCNNFVQKEIERSQCYETICWNPETYPAEEIMTKLSEANEDMDSFGQITTIRETFREEEASCSMCKHMVNMRIYPLTLQDDDEVFYIVRTERYQHSITLNLCASEEVQKEESICMNAHDKDTLDLKKACEQKLSNIKFLVYDQKNGKFTEKNLQYPSACVCTIQRNTNV